VSARGLVHSDTWPGLRVRRRASLRVVSGTKMSSPPRVRGTPRFRERSTHAVGGRGTMV
jgi:hypothetical protein